MPTSDGSGSEAVIRRRTPISQRRRDGLIQFAKDIKSQNGEDGIIEKIFELLPKPTRNHRVCVDVGAWDGKHLSNTFALLVDTSQQDGGNAVKDEWKGLLIEADADRFEELRGLHEPLGNTCLDVTVTSSTESPDSLVAILLNHQDTIPHDFDFLSIDVDGSDYWLLRDLWVHTQFRPAVVCIEANPTMPNDLIYIPPRDDALRHGASVAALVELATQHGYVLVETTVYNCFFVRQELYHNHLRSLVPDTSIEALHEITMGTAMYQLYDGTLKLWGCKKLLWHRVGMNEDKMQMIPPSKRSFPFAPTAEKEPENVIDLSPYLAGATDTALARKETAAALLHQLRKDGFALVRGSGISATVCEEALSSTRAFLHEADESVRRSCLTQDRARRGYAPMCTENFASLIGDVGPNDLVRKFRIGRSTESSSGSPLHRPNVWPSADQWEGAEKFKTATETYYGETCEFISVVVQAIVEGLVSYRPELYESLNVVNKETQDEHSSILTLLGYRKGARHKKTQKKRHIHPLVASHTDVSQTGECRSSSVWNKFSDQASGWNNNDATFRWR